MFKDGTYLKKHLFVYLPNPMAFYIHLPFSKKNSFLYYWRSNLGDNDESSFQSDAKDCFGC